jgi:RNA polymerase sigma-70 factor (ECF subfamily)
VTVGVATLDLMREQWFQPVAESRAPLGGPDDDGVLLLRRAVSSRDEIAWQRLVGMHRPAIVRQAVRACGDGSLAEDIAQDVLLKVFRSAGSFRGDHPLAHWIARITTHATIDAMRRRSRVASVDLEAAGQQAGISDHPEGELARAECRRRVREAVLRLPAREREALWLTTFGELSYQAAAEELRVPLRTVMSRALAARTRLRRVLVDLEPVA